MVRRKRDWSESEIAQIKDLFVGQKKSAGTIAKLFGEHKTTMDRAIKGFGFKREALAKLAASGLTPMQRTIKTMWVSGIPTAEIAEAVSKQEGKAFSVQAITGHVARMKLPRRTLRGATEASRLKAAAAKKPKPFNIPPQNGMGGPKAAKVGPSSVDTKATFDPLKLDGKFITLENLHHRNMCKYPIGDPAASNFHFCGHTPKKSSAYCEAHHSRCYTPTTNQSNVNRDYARNSGINRIG